MKKAAVIVLGDVGRSPRMLYHVSSLASQGVRVKLIGYDGAAPPSEILQNKLIDLVYVKNVPSWIERMPRLLGYFMKTLFQAITLFFCLLFQGRMDFVLVQNPPAIPTLPVAFLYAFLVRARFIIDFHNYAYTRLAHTLHSDRHPLVRISRVVERVVGRLADVVFSVSQAMKNDLEGNWRIGNVVTLYDRPPRKFKRLSTAESHALFCKLAREYPVFQSTSKARDASETQSADSPSETRFTRRKDAKTVEFRPDRPALLVSSTSWSDDEDFGILFDALTRYEAAFDESNQSKQPNLVCVITGRGPLKEFYLAEIARRTWHHVEFCTPWLSAEDYPALLGAADFGVCLHSSTSGLDLPMKVVDMFGAALPTLALNYSCLNELVIPNRFGLLFDSPEQLLDRIKDVLRGFPGECAQLALMRQNLQAQFRTRWNDEWQRVFWSKVETLCYPKRQD